jgi:hypothetical protein
VDVVLLDNVCVSEQTAGKFQFFLCYMSQQRSFSYG